MLRLIFFLMFVLCCSAQSRNDWRLSVQYGTTVPSSCEGGKIFIKTNATSGSNSYACVNGSYVLQGGSGSSLTYGTFASLPATCSAGDRYLTSDSLYEFSCTSANTWTPFYKGKRVYLPTSVSFSDLNSPSSGSTIGGSIYWKVAGTGANFRGKIATIPSAPYTLTVLIRTNFKPSNFARSGLILYDGTKVFFCGITDAGQIKSSNFSNVSTFASDNTVSPDYSLPQGDIWLRLADDNTNRYCRVSLDGINWQETLSQSRTAYLTPTYWGVAGNSENSNDIHITVISAVAQ